MIKLVAEKVVDFRKCYPQKIMRVIVILIIFVGLYACGSNSYRAPVKEVAQPPSRKVSTHIVAPGETLFSIAWRYDLDYASLARVNEIGTNYTIIPGQSLDLNVNPRVPWRQKEQTRNAPKITKPKKAATGNRSKKETKESVLKSDETKIDQSLKWQWPLKGKLLSRFRAKNGLQKGVDIRCKLGESVLAASSGTVVYAGDGLRGYGKLLIVKHNEKYLSAYAHNRRLLVEEGELVKRGHRIAEAGATGTDTVKLYFEIRYNGKPVDPLRYLPQN